MFEHCQYDDISVHYWLLPNVAFDPENRHRQLLIQHQTIEMLDEHHLLLELDQ